MKRTIIGLLLITPLCLFIFALIVFSWKKHWPAFVIFLFILMAGIGFMLLTSDEPKDSK